MTTILILIFSIALCIIGFFMNQKPEGLLQLISPTNKNKQFIKRYSILLILFGCIGVISSFFLTKTLALWFICILLVVSMFFSFQFSKKMSERS